MYKIIYYGYVLILPLLFFNTWWLVLIGYFVMHYTCGIILAIVFQCAHVMEPNEFKSPNKDRVIKRNWFEHQLNTTCNFAMNSRIGIITECETLLVSVLIFFIISEEFLEIISK